MKRLIIFILSFLTISSYSQTNKNGLKIEIPSVLISGSQQQIDIQYHEKILIPIPEIKNFEFLNNSSSYNISMIDGKKTDNYRNTINFRCKKEGKYIIPPIKVFTKTDTLYTNEQYFEIIKSDKYKNRKIDSTIILPILDSIAPAPYACFKRVF